VGHAAALVAAATLLATIAQLNLTNVFIRLVPNAGHLGRNLVLKGYLAVVCCAIVAGTVYVLSGLAGHLIGGGTMVRVGFVMGVVILAIFALQDSVLTSLRLAPWVTVENGTFAVSKVLLLPVLILPAPALALGSAGIVVAWLVPASVAVVIVSWLLVRRIFPARAHLEGKLPQLRRLLSLVAAEYVCSTCSTATSQLMPLVIVWRLGSANAAYFTMPWLLAGAVVFLMWNVSASFIVELAAAGGHADALVRRSALLLAGIIVSVVTVCVIAAHPMLEILGSKYAEHGTGLLRLIGLTTPFSAVVVVYSTLAWVDQRLWLLAGWLAASGSTLVLVTVILLPRLGLAAAGWTYLGTQAISAVIMAPLAVARLRRGELAEAL
jgi:O-antigen/teichoic acid export membrane protein